MNGNVDRTTRALNSYCSVFPWMKEGRGKKKVKFLHEDGFKFPFIV